MNRLTPPLPGPRFLAAPLKIIPERLISTPLEAAINHIFREPLDEGEFDFLESHWVKLHITDMELEFHLGFDGTKLIMSSARPCDVTFKGSSSAFSTLALRREDPDTLFFRRELMIEGNTELGLGLKNLLASLDLEQLPKPFRHLLNLGNRFQDFTAGKAH